MDCWDSNFASSRARALCCLTASDFLLRTALISESNFIHSFSNRSMVAIDGVAKVASASAVPLHRGNRCISFSISAARLSLSARSLAACASRSPCRWICWIMDRNAWELGEAGVSFSLLSVLEISLRSLSSSSDFESTRASSPSYLFPSDWIRTILSAGMRRSSTLVKSSDRTIDRRILRASRSFCC